MWKLAESKFEIIPEGEYVFKITKVDWDDEFGSLEIKFKTADGKYSHTEKYQLRDGDGEINENANRAYSYLARTALNDYSIDEIEHTDLLGKYLEARVEHTVVPNKKDPDKNYTYAHLKDMKPVTSMPAEELPVQTKGNTVENLDALFKL